MYPKHILHIVGARPNFPKLAPVVHEMKRRGYDQNIIHTGQHYDHAMSSDILKQLDIYPDHDLGLRTVPEITKTLALYMNTLWSDLVMVYGDVNSTLAAALAAQHVGIPVAHVESGLRSGDWTMPEEVNRYVVDHLSSILFTTCEDANKNLAEEGIEKRKIVFVGNTMIDSLVKVLPFIDRKSPYGLVTLHRPSNVDNPQTMQKIIGYLSYLRTPLVFPKHPRTKLLWVPQNMTVTEPASYLDFLKLESGATFVITDSGGVQEETTFLSVPCLTLRENTERPVTVTLGTNKLIDAWELVSAETEILDGRWKKGTIPPLWDGHAAERIVDYIESL